MKIANKISSYLESVDEKTIYYLLGGVLFFVFLLDYFILMKPQISTLVKISPEINLLSDDIAKAKNDIQRFQQYKKEVEDLKGKVKKSNKKLKFKEEVPLILENISFMADNNGIIIDRVMPNFPEQKVLLENNERRYYGLPIFIKARSNYHDFGSFLNQIENGDIFFNVSSFAVVATTGKRKHVIEIVLDAVIYEELK